MSTAEITWSALADPVRIRYAMFRGELYSRRNELVFDDVLHNDQGDWIRWPPKPDQVCGLMYHVERRP